MDRSIGRREARTRATRQALREAAKRLFAEHGFEATTIRDIAAAANVTERTFYRYFDGKEELLAEETLAWLDVLREAIRNRPAQEPPFTALRQAMLEIVQQAAPDAGPARFWLFSDSSRPFALLRRTTPRPLLRVERSIAGAILSRSSAYPDRGEHGRPDTHHRRSSDDGGPPDDNGSWDDNGPSDGQAEFEAHLLARVAVAALRTAAIRHRQLQAAGHRSPGIERLLRDAFAALAQLTQSAQPQRGG